MSKLKWLIWDRFLRRAMWVMIRRLPRAVRSQSVLRLVEYWMTPWNLLRHRRRLADILRAHSGHIVVLGLPNVRWNIPLYQRPQHLALSLGKRGALYFFPTPQPHRDLPVNGFTELGPGCYLTDRYDLLKRLPNRKVLHVYSTDPGFDARKLERARRREDTIVYEYIDEMHEHISGAPVQKEILERHALAVRYPEIICVATARRLYEEVVAARGSSRNVHLVTNGVDCEHFSLRRTPETVSPPELAPILAAGQPLVGYHGALAPWVDYGLLKTVAALRPNYQFLMIGPEYDASQPDLSRAGLSNLHRFKAIPYDRLPTYAVWYDVAMIPFRVYELTHSTSPIKLFEYMALGHPIVTTGLDECRYYKSVLIGDGPEAFAERLDEALALRSDMGYQAVLRREALENTWDAKADVLAGIIRSSLGNGAADCAPSTLPRRREAPK